MKTLRGGRRGLASRVVALVLGTWSGSACLAQQVDKEGVPGVAPAPGLKKKKEVKGFFGRREPSKGTLGYGPPGVYPGFQGFGLGYRLGYGYGWGALGVGAEGGYPLYGGPGYPHPGPELRRYPLTKIEPFCFLGGSGFPSPEHPNFYGTVGPLIPDDPVVKPGDDTPDSNYDGSYGTFTGTLPYPEQTFAPYSAPGGDPSTDAKPFDIDPTPPPGPRTPAPEPPGPPSSGDSVGAFRDGDTLGIDAESVIKVDGELGLKVTRVYPGKPAEKSKIAAGDLIRSANGYVTEQPGNLVWIIANAAPDRVLKLSVRTAADGAVRTVTAPLR